MHNHSDDGALQDRVQQCFAAYRAKDRSRLEAMRAPDFTLSSPYDERLIRLQYLERCWPDSERVEARQVENVVERGDEALVQFRTRRVQSDKVKGIEVYFDEVPVERRIVFTPGPVSAV
jgi:ketosteroid isomerase-like protein